MHGRLNHGCGRTSRGHAFLSRAARGGLVVSNPAGTAVRAVRVPQPHDHESVPRRVVSWPEPLHSMHERRTQPVWLWFRVPITHDRRERPNFHPRPRHAGHEFRLAFLACMRPTMDGISLHSAPGGLVFAYPVTTFRVFAYSAIMIASGMSWYGGTAGKRRRGRPPGGPARRPPASAGHPVTDGQMLINRYFADPVVRHKASRTVRVRYKDRIRWPCGAQGQNSAGSGVFRGRTQGAPGHPGTEPRGCAAR
jgi:hypothetical protein